MKLVTTEELLAGDHDYRLVTQTNAKLRITTTNRFNKLAYRLAKPKRKKLDYLDRWCLGDYRVHTETIQVKT